MGNQVQNGWVLAVVNEKGGCGKTTASITLACGFAASGRETVMLDTDTENGSALAWAATCKADARLTVVGMPSEEVLTNSIPNLRKKYDIVLIDGGANSENLLTATVAMADLIIIPTKPSPLDLMKLKGVMKVVRKVQGMRVNAGGREAQIFFLVNQAVKSSRLSHDIHEALSAFGYPILDTVLANRVGFEQSLIGGSPLVSDDPKTRDEALALFEEVRNRLGQPAGRTAAAVPAAG